MAEFRKELSQPNTSFSRVTPTASTSSSQFGTALQGLVTGVEVIGKEKARAAGMEAAEGQRGLDLTLEEVNRDVDEIQAQMDEALMYEKSLSDEGEVSARRIQEVKDQSLRQARLTDRHLQGLVDARVISSTEADARRQIELSKLKKQGANFLFSSEFDDVFFRATGGSSGAAVSAMFPKTPEEIRAAEIAKAENEAIAAVEAEVAGLLQLMPEMSESQARIELRNSHLQDKRLKELNLIKQERDLNADEVAEQMALDQTSRAQGFELVINNLKDENGLLGQDGLIKYKEMVTQSAAEQRRELASTTGLTDTDRSARLQEINNWEESQIERGSMLSRVNYSKDQVQLLEDARSIYGAAANPEVFILSKYNPDLAKALVYKTKDMQQEFYKKYVGKAAAETVTNGAKVVKEIANFYTGRAPVKNYNFPALMLGTEEGMKEFTNGMTADRVDPKWVKMVKAAPAETISSFTRPGGIKIDGKFIPDANQVTMKKVFDLYKNDLVRTREDLGLGDIKVTEEWRGLSRNTRAEIPDALIEGGDPAGYRNSIKEAYSAFRLHSWLWQDDFESAEEAFNEYINGRYEITTMKDREMFKEDETKDKQDN